MKSAHVRTVRLPVDGPASCLRVGDGDPHTRTRTVPINLAVSATLVAFGKVNSQREPIHPVFVHVRASERDGANAVSRTSTVAARARERNGRRPGRRVEQRGSTARAECAYTASRRERNCAVRVAKYNNNNNNSAQYCVCCVFVLHTFSPFLSLSIFPLFGNIIAGASVCVSGGTATARVRTCPRPVAVSECARVCGRLCACTHNTSNSLVILFSQLSSIYTFNQTG